ncbi:MAG TPA: tRNA preQ1(34) S-adenosylmethionine ribosyltransferase-isomerase QueA [Planctomycetaceae bacterium]|nr:tRNA preQ1(34) S-adenosylmethionine ribosyltransferase-isomerase QueA [Planctomycetaceae bacterium]
MAEPDLNLLSSWQYNLPDELIASRPTARRDDSRLLVVDRKTGQIHHHMFRDLPDLLNDSSHLVFNDTRVLPARLFGVRTQTGGKWEGLFLNQEADGRWRITGQTRGRLQQGESLTLNKAGEAVELNGEGPELKLEERGNDGTWLVTPPSDETVSLLEEYGTLPLPPYMSRRVADAEDADRYQTVYAAENGAIAAPTAGLHFTPEILARCESRGILQSFVTLHVGIGTFRPVGAERLSEHHMHSEWCRVSLEEATRINHAKEAGQQIVAVGTTSVRTLEAAAAAGRLTAFEDTTELFIQPGFTFNCVDRLLTNFHLPGSTLIVLVAALAGYELTMEAYSKALQSKYRFYSYGDAMLIL